MSYCFGGNDCIGCTANFIFYAAAVIDGGGALEYHCARCSRLEFIPPLEVVDSQYEI